MKRNKGISMISLVIIVVVTVILIGIATTAGYRYIVEGDRVKSEAVVSIISEAAYRRQNDLSSGVAVAYYEGYSFDVYSNKSKYAEITGLPEEFDSGDIEVPDCLEENGAKWYLFDADSASALGVKESERFIERNISYPDGLKDDEITLVLADYMTGKGYLVDIPKDLIKDSIRQDSGCLNSPDGNHNYKIIATCTEPARCIYCGEADPMTPALGHDFAPPTCTASGICRRCGAVDPENGPLGHLMISNDDIDDPSLIAKMAAKNYRMYKNGDITDAVSANYAWITDALKHWHECLRCGEKNSEQEHNKGCIPVDGEDEDEYHYDFCSICGWESIKSKHVFVYQELSDNTHIKKCTLCNYSETHNDSDWLPGHSEYHYRTCKEEDKCVDGTLIINGVTTEILFKEPHSDSDNDLICDECGHSLDFEPPLSFGSSQEYYAKTIGVTTSTITVEAFTIDEGSGLSYYQFGIYNPDTKAIEWGGNVYPEDPNVPEPETFKDLKANTEYAIYVKAADKSGNFTPAYQIPDTVTAKLPTLKGLTNIPDTYVKGPIYAGIAPIETDLTNLTIKYSLDGEEWNSIPITDIDSATIELTKEIEIVRVKIVDDSLEPNETEISEYVIEKIDLTPPVVTIAATSGDNNTELALSHKATVVITDQKAGIAANTEVKYAWSTSNTEVPTDFETVYTKNTETVYGDTIEIPTPEGVKGQYYLCILEGVEDRLGNPTEKPVWSDMYFNIDDEDVMITNIKMLDLSPAVAQEYLFVKTGGVVTISFEADKELGKSPTVLLNGQAVQVETVDGLSYRGSIVITDSYEEGTLQLEITNVVSATGKVSSKTYTNDDLTEGPVIYDRTLPVFEYISKN